MASLDKANTAATAAAKDTNTVPTNREIRRAKDFHRAQKAIKLKLNNRNNRCTPCPDFLEINFPETRSMMKKIKSSINKPVGYHIRFNNMIRNHPRHHEELMKTMDKELDYFVHCMNTKE